MEITLGLKGSCADKSRELFMLIIRVFHSIAYGIRHSVSLFDFWIFIYTARMDGCGPSPILRAQGASLNWS